MTSLELCFNPKRQEKTTWQMTTKASRVHATTHINHQVCEDTDQCRHTRQGWPLDLWSSMRHDSETGQEMLAQQTSTSLSLRVWAPDNEWTRNILTGSGSNLLYVEYTIDVICLCVTGLAFKLLKCTQSPDTVLNLFTVLF